MIVYGDILFILNMTVDYLLLSLSEVIIKRKTPLLRRVLAAVLGGISSFYIFFEISSILADLAFRVAVSLLMTLVAFGRKKLLKRAAVLLTLSLLQSGITGFLCELFKIGSITVKGMAVYVDISPLFIIIFSLAFYLIISLIFRLRKNRAPLRFCTVCLGFKDKRGEFRALIDSGNTLSDPFSDSEVLLIDKTSSEKFFGMPSELVICGENKTRFRLLPIRTVKGEGVLKGIRLDSAELKCGTKNIRLSKPLLTFSEEKSFGDFEMIVPEGIFEGR